MHEKNKLENSLATDEKKQRSLWQEAWRRFRKNRMAMIGLAFITFLVVVSITTLVIDLTTHNAVYNEYVVKQDLFNRLKGPSAQHIFGQDEFGRDMLLRMLWGAWSFRSAGQTAARRQSCWAYRQEARTSSRQSSSCSTMRP